MSKTPEVSQNTSFGRREFFCGLGLLSTAFVSRAQALDSVDDENVRLVTAFCNAWSTKDPNIPLTYLSPDCVYRMTEKTPRINGPEAIRQALAPAVAASDHIEFRILESLALGPIVINHRIDNFDSKTRPLIWEGVGVFFIRDKRIAEWSDYTIRIHR